MCVCGAQHVCSKHLQEDSVACSQRGGLGSDLASLLGLIQSMTAWKLEKDNIDTRIPLPVSFIHTIFQPNEGPQCGCWAKCGAPQWEYYWMHTVILLDMSHTQKKTCLKLNWAVEGILLFVQTASTPQLKVQQYHKYSHICFIIYYLVGFFL